MFSADKKLKIIRKLKIEKYVPTRIILPIYYEHHMHRKLNLKNPKTFSEKLQWLKIYYKDPIMTKLVDKIEVREYIKKTLGEEYLFPIIGIYDKFEDIDFNCLPQKFVMKCNHDSGSYVICANKDTFDIQNAKNKINEHLKQNYYYYWREWPYKNIKPKILVEEYMEDISSHDCTDYKFLCFEGKVDNVLVCSERQRGVKFHYFDKQWNFKKYNYEGLRETDDFSMPKPEKFDEMIEIAEKLAGDFPCIRVDLYYINHKIYFGELTFFPNAGFNADLLDETDYFFGEKIKLKKYYKEK